jgi:Ti-type conjugative transfer relaxase TraA
LVKDGEPLRVVTPDRVNGKIVYKLWAGDKETMKAWKIAWAETANRHLALAGHEIRLDGRSYAEQGLDGIAQKHLGPEKAALARKGREMYFAPADLARRQEMADRLLAEPELLLKQLANERSTFDERDIAKALHRYVDDPVDFANIRGRLMASDDLVMLKPQEIEPETSKVSEPAVFTTRDMLRIEYDMAQSARTFCRSAAASASPAGMSHPRSKRVETGDAKTSFRLDPEQVDAVRHVTGDSGIAAIVGLAGAGKSTLLAAARVAWESEGRRVIGAALAGKAAEGLEDSSGIRSRTLASWELAWANGRETLHRGDVLVIDEAGMVASQQMGRVLKIAEAAEAPKSFWSAMRCSFSRSRRARRSGRSPSGSVLPSLPACAASVRNGRARLRGSLPVARSRRARCLCRSMAISSRRGRDRRSSIGSSPTGPKRAKRRSTSLSQRQ